MEVCVGAMVVAGGQGEVGRGGHKLVSQQRRSRNIGNALAINNNSLVIYILSHTHTHTYATYTHTHTHTHIHTRTHTSRPVNIVCVC